VIGSIVFTVLMFLSVPPASLIVVALRPFGLAPAYRAACTWAALIDWLCRHLCGLRFVVEGRENLPAEASVVLVKHSSSYETIMQMLLFPPQAWVLKGELMWAPFLGWGLAVLQPIAINRSSGRNAVAQVVEQGARRLQEGRWVVIFPEGTRMPAGETRRYGVSGTLLAQQTGRLLVPVAHDAGYFWPRRGWLKRPGIVRFCIGPPVDPRGRDPREVNEEIQAWVEKRVAELRRGHSDI
jgi:1-acyl-sn-glycerol-3-phosphate acyltransferase